MKGQIPWSNVQSKKLYCPKARRMKPVCTKKFTSYEDCFRAWNVMIHEVEM